MSFNYITKDGITFILSCVVTMSLANFDYHILSSPTTHPHHPTSYYYKVYGSSCLQCVLGVVKMIYNLIWPWVLLFVFVLGRNKNVKFSSLKGFLFERWHVKFSKYILEVFFSFLFSWIPCLEKKRVLTPTPHECGKQVGLNRFR
jgi:hypothetical protein